MAHLPEVQGVLECPCNWFGSDCPDDWAPIEGIEHTTVYGDLMAMTLTLKPENWKKVIANHQPGGVIRIVHRDPTNPVGGRMREQLYALAYAPSEGKLEILTAPTDMALHPTVREVAERVRSLPTGPIIGGNLFVNPIIAVFFNKEWAFLMDVVRSSHFTIDRLVILSKGAGLSRALSAVEATTRLGLKGIHLYHGLRNVQDLPFRERLEELESSGALALTIIESSVSESSNVGVPNKQRESQELREEVKLSVVYLPWKTSKVFFLMAKTCMYSMLWDSTLRHLRAHYWTMELPYRIRLLLLVVVWRY